MKRFVLAAFLSLVVAVPAAAQNPQPPTPPSTSFAPPGAPATPLSVTTTSARVALPQTPTIYPVYTLVNNGTAKVFCKGGDVTVVASTSDYTFALAANSYRATWDKVSTYIACITSTGTATVDITQSNGGPTLGFLSGGSVGGATGANPTATIGATAVNGTATTFMRSDGAPALPATLPALNGSALTNVSASGSRPAYLGVVTTGNNLSNALGSSLHYANAAKQHYFRSTSYTPRIVIPNFYVIAAGGEVGSGSSCTATGYIFWNGVWQQFKFSGNSVGTVPNASYLISDPLTVTGGPIPAGTWTLTGVWEDCPGGVFYMSPITNGNIDVNIAAGEGFEYSASALPDRFAAGGSFTPSDTVNITGDIGILDTTTADTFTCAGDSISQGQNDNEDGTTNFGICARALGNKYAYFNFGVASRTQAQYLTSHTLETALAQYTTGVVNQLGANDVNGGISAATMEGAAASIAALTPTKQNYKTTVLPITSSINSYVTTAGQTVSGNESNRTAWNTYIRSVAAASNTVGYIETANVVETTTTGVRTTVTNGGVWKAPLITAAGSVAITADGLHPNPAGNLLFNGIGFGPSSAAIQ